MEGEFLLSFCLLLTGRSVGVSPQRRAPRVCDDAAVSDRLSGTVCWNFVVALIAGWQRSSRHKSRCRGLLRGKAQCNACHRDGGPGEDPLFTDVTASNIATPPNPRLPYYAEQDARGYVANPAGLARRAWPRWSLPRATR